MNINIAALLNVVATHLTNGRNAYQLMSDFYRNQIVSKFDRDRIRSIVRSIVACMRQDPMTVCRKWNARIQEDLLKAELNFTSPL